MRGVKLIVVVVMISILGLVASLLLNQASHLDPFNRFIVDN